MYDKKRFLLCRNTRPFADWLMVVTGATTHLVSFQAEPLKVHNWIELAHPATANGFSEVSEEEVREIIDELKSMAKTNKPRRRRKKTAPAPHPSVRR